MRLAPIIAAIMLTGCAFAEGAGGGKAEPCVKQDRCLIWCTASNNRCGKEQDDGAT